MEELQVPTRTIDVEIFELGDKHMTGCLFISEAECQSGKHLAVFNLLNDDRRFVPFGIIVDSERQNVVILNKQRILRVRMDNSPEEAGDIIDDTGVQHETHASFVLSDGSSIAGTLNIEAPWMSSRLVDKLNQTERFIPVADGHVFHFIQTAHVAEAN